MYSLSVFEPPLPHPPRYLMVVIVPPTSAVPFPFPSCLHFISCSVLWPFSSLTISLATIYSLFYFPFMSSMFVTILSITSLPLNYFNHLCCSQYQLKLKVLRHFPSQVLTSSMTDCHFVNCVNIERKKNNKG